MTIAHPFEAPRDESEMAALARVLGDCYASTEADMLRFLDAGGHPNVRVFREEGRLVGGLLLIPMGQYWGGRSVRMGGVAGVGVAPVARGTGAATRMMAAAMSELRASKYAVSTLYPATQPLYRRVGFEQAGDRFELALAVDRLPESSREATLRAFVPEDLPRVQSLYAHQARHRSGHLDRGPYIWTRVQAYRGQPASGYVVEGPSGMEGYIFLRRVAKSSLRYDLVIHDWLARTAEAAERLLRFVRDHASQADDVRWSGGADDPFLLLLREQKHTLRLADTWMLRILDVQAALSARGYPRGVSATLQLSVDDSLFPENAGSFRLEVSGGEGRVTRSEGMGLRCDVRTLAALYSGHRSAQMLSGLGRLEGSSEALELATALFSGPAPSMVDAF